MCLLFISRCGVWDRILHGSDSPALPERGLQTPWPPWHCSTGMCHHVVYAVSGFWVWDQHLRVCYTPTLAPWPHSRLKLLHVLITSRCLLYKLQYDPVNYCILNQIFYLQTYKSTAALTLFPFPTFCAMLIILSYIHLKPQRQISSVSTLWAGSLAF